MLKNPYVSRVFGHLFDLVRLVMHSVSARINLATKRISICIIRALTKRVLTAKTTSLTAAAAIINEKRVQSGSFFDTRNLFAKLFDFVQSFSTHPTLYQNAKIRKQMGSSICSKLFDKLEFIFQPKWSICFWSFSTNRPT